METQFEQLLNEARNEINRLRLDNHILSAQVDVIKICDRMMRAQVPTEAMGYSEDVVWKINTVLNALERQREQNVNTNNEPKVKSKKK